MTDDQGPAWDETVEANRAREQGLGVGARELDRQRDPSGSGAGTPEGQGGADGLERQPAGRES